MTITALPTPPSTNDPANFATRADAFMAALPTFANEVNAMGLVISSGSIISIPYTFSTTTTDADPGAGIMRFNNATQNATTVLRTDLAGSDASDWTTGLDSFDDCNHATVKGWIRIFKTSDATKYLLFSVTSLAAPSGYRNITVVCLAYSAASPFANSDALTLQFVRNADVGATGASGTSTLDYSSSGTGDVTPPTLPSTICVGYLGVPVVASNSTRNIIATDLGKDVYHTSATPHTFTIQANATLALPIGSSFRISNESGGGAVTVAITSDTLRWGSSTGSRTIAANGSAVLHKKSATVWRMTGEGIT